MKGKTILVTGATDGIGRETARVLAQMGARVVIVGRNAAKCVSCATEIGQETGNGAVSSLTADLSSLGAIAQLADDVARFVGPIDVLVNNAGAMFTRRQVSTDGFEMTFALNHLGYFALTLRLLDLIGQRMPARIVNVASGAHQGVTLDFDDLQATRGYSGMRQYQRSKLCNILFTRALARRVHERGITVNCLHPGFVASAFGTNNPGAVFGFVLRMAKSVAAIDVARGARTSIHLASSSAVADVTGAYFVASRPVEPSPAARDDAAAERLWAASAAMTGLDL